MAFEDYESPRFVNKGQEVWAPFRRNPETGAITALKCTVVVAAGYHAQVANEKYDFCKWFDIYDLRIRRIVVPEPPPVPLPDPFAFLNSGLIPGLTVKAQS